MECVIRIPHILCHTFSRKFSSLLWRLKFKSPVGLLRDCCWLGRTSISRPVPTIILIRLYQSSWSQRQRELVGLLPPPLLDLRLRVSQITQRGGLLLFYLLSFFLSTLLLLISLVGNKGLFFFFWRPHQEGEKSSSRVLSIVILLQLSCVD